ELDDGTPVDASSGSGPAAGGRTGQSGRAVGRDHARASATTRGVWEHSVVVRGCPPPPCHLSASVGTSRMLMKWLALGHAPGLIAKQFSQRSKLQLLLEPTRSAFCQGARVAETSPASRAWRCAFESRAPTVSVPST